MSSCEAEYIAATTTTYQAVWMIRLIRELTSNEESTVKVMVDNQSTITLSKNTGHHNCTKHIDTRYHFIRECVEDKRIEIVFIQTEDQLADMLTKALGRIKFQEMRGQIGIHNAPMEELEHGGD